MRALLRAVRFLLGLAVRTDPRRLAVACTLLAVGYLATPLIGLALRAFTNAALSGAALAATVFALAAAVLLVFELTMGHFAHLSYFALGELSAAALDAELVTVTNGTPRMGHLDDPGFADTLAVVRQDVAQIRPALEAVLQLAGLLVQAGVSTVVLATVNPWLGLLPAAAVPSVLIARRAQHLVDQATEDSAAQIRRSTHLVELATSPAAATEIRLYDAADHLTDVQDRCRTATAAALWQAHRRGAALRAAGQLLFALAYGTAVFLVVGQAARGTANLGDVVLVITLAVQIGAQVANVLGQLAKIQGAGRTADRLASLRTRSAADTHPPDRPPPAPTRLEHGIRLDHVGFTYPGATRASLRDVTLDLPAGRTVALVGENGAGKSTLVKLLCGLYAPTSGTITVDGTDLADLDPAAWSDGVAMLFQDFARFELLLRENVGVGDLPRLDDDTALHTALTAARAEPVLRRVPGGLDGLLGGGYGDGASLSGGQWQALGLARALMRQTPLLLALDEPAAALDAPSEHALFARFAASADRAGQAVGAITLFVSHRFSTVRMADLIVVLDAGRVVECGSHAELMARGGLYAELYSMQARAYR